MQEDGVSSAVLHKAKQLFFDSISHLLQQQRLDEAEQLVDEYHKHWHNETSLLGFMAHSLYQQGYFQKAGVWFERVIDWNQEPPLYVLSCFLYLAQVYSPQYAREFFKLHPQNRQPTTWEDAISAWLLDALMNSEMKHAREYVEEIFQSFSPSKSPRILKITSPFVGYILRRLEAPDQPAWYIHSAKVLGMAAYVEHDFTPYRSTDCVTLTRLLLLTGKRQEAWNVTERETKENNTFTSGFAYLGLFAWMHGYSSLARKALKQLNIQTSANSDQLFARWVACAVNGDLHRANICMNQLFHLSPDYFVAHPSVTVWGMLALALRAMGQQVLFLRAMQVAEKQDPLHGFRLHLIEHVPTPISPRPFPPFKLPEFL